MPNKDYKEILGFTEPWFLLGIVTEENFAQFVVSYKNGVDTSSEHHRYGAFRRHVQANRPLFEDQATALYNLGASDPDIAMGQAMMGDIIALPECPLSVLTKAEHSGISPLIRKVERRYLLDELKSGVVTEELFIRSFASGDGVIHRYLAETVNLSHKQLQVLAERGANKAVRHLAIVRLNQNRFTLEN